MCKISLILNFWREFLTIRGREKRFSRQQSRSQFVATGPAKNLKTGNKDNVLMAKNNFE